MIFAPPAQFQRLGKTTYANIHVNSVFTVLSAAANINGAVLRTAVLLSQNSRFCILRAGTNYLRTVINTSWNYDGPGILINAGVAIILEGDSASISGETQGHLSWDLL